MGRLSQTEALLGPELFNKVRTTPVLVVGAGGIGCELLKNLVLVGFSNIEILDLDTIDLSNLNRQFLFRKPDISKSKALVAKTAALHFNPKSGINIHARHGNVKEPENDLEWIGKFGLVMNALDNFDARRHVNKLCMAANVPLIESGTAGYLGQVTCIVHNETECYDCTPKAAPKSFPVCTIRSTPSEPIHCIVWGKSYLFGKLFGEDDEALDEAELDKAKADGENAEEIENLKKEAAAFREVRRLLGEEDGAQRVFRKVFYDDINRLLAMEDMWKVAGRVKPVPLDYDAIMNGTFVAPPARTSTQGTSSSASNGTSSQAVLKDQKELSLKENLELFVDSCQRLSARSIAHPDVVLSFDKDDDDTLDFVLAVANLRATAYGIAPRTRFQVKEMAGNIIPAIATTNAVVAGMVVMQALGVLRGDGPGRNPYITPTPRRPVSNTGRVEPNPDCAVCRDLYIPFKVDVQRCTLGHLVNDVIGGWLKSSVDDDEFEVSVLEGGRILADPDFDDNHGKTLGELGLERGKMITVIDEEGKYRPIHFCVLQPEPNASGAYTLPDTPPHIPVKPAPASAQDSEIEDVDEFMITDGTEFNATRKGAVAPVTSVKRPAPDDDVASEPKKRKLLGTEENAIVLD